MWLCETHYYWRWSCAHAGLYCKGRMFQTRSRCYCSDNVDYKTRVSSSVFFLPSFHQASIISQDSDEIDSFYHNSNTDLYIAFRRRTQLQYHAFHQDTSRLCHSLSSFLQSSGPRVPHHLTPFSPPRNPLNEPCPSPNHQRQTRRVLYRRKTLYFLSASTLPDRKPDRVHCRQWQGFLGTRAWRSPVQITRILETEPTITGRLGRRRTKPLRWSSRRTLLYERRQPRRYTRGCCDDEFHLHPGHCRWPWIVHIRRTRQ